MDGAQYIVCNFSSSAPAAGCFIVYFIVFRPQGEKNYPPIFTPSRVVKVPPPPTENQVAQVWNVG